MDNEKLIEDILNHLDQETQMGRPANETVGLLDCYTDMNAGRPDNER